LLRKKLSVGILDMTKLDRIVPNEKQFEIGKTVWQLLKCSNVNKDQFHVLCGQRDMSASWTKYFLSYYSTSSCFINIFSVALTMLSAPKLYWDKNFFLQNISAYCLITLSVLHTAITSVRFQNKFVAFYFVFTFTREVFTNI
jgi:hypothetical protein